MLRAEVSKTSKEGLSMSRSDGVGSEQAKGVHRPELSGRRAIVDGVLFGLAVSAVYAAARAGVDALPPPEIMFQGLPQSLQEAGKWMQLSIVSRDVGKHLMENGADITKGIVAAWQTVEPLFPVGLGGGMGAAEVVRNVTMAFGRVQQSETPNQKEQRLAEEDKRKREGQPEGKHGNKITFYQRVAAFLQEPDLLEQKGPKVRQHNIEQLEKKLAETFGGRVALAVEQGLPKKIEEAGFRGAMVGVSGVLPQKWTGPAMKDIARAVDVLSEQLTKDYRLTRDEKVWAEALSFLALADVEARAKESGGEYALRRVGEKKSLLLSKTEQAVRAIAASLVRPHDKRIPWGQYREEFKQGGKESAIRILHAKGGVGEGVVGPDGTRYSLAQLLTTLVVQTGVLMRENGASAMLASVPDKNSNVRPSS